MDALVEQLAGEAVGGDALDGAGRDDHAGADVAPDDVGGVGDRAEQGHPGDRLWVGLGVVHEPEDPVAEPGLGLQHGGELTTLGVGAGDHDVAHEEPALTERCEETAGDLALDGDEEDRDHEQHDERRAGHELAERVGEERDRQGRERDAVDDAPDLVDASTDEAGVVEALAGEDPDPDREAGERELGEAMCAPTRPAGADHRVGERDGDGHGHEVGRHQGELGLDRGAARLDRHMVRGGLDGTAPVVWSVCHGAAYDGTVGTHGHQLDPFPIPQRGPLPNS